MAENRRYGGELLESLAEAVAQRPGRGVGVIEEERGRIAVEYVQMGIWYGCCELG